ncbi:fibronectin type III-like domain-contianing protein, partial [Klebsiella pneumoniae]|uniref:fibronectin type III-like domain-contianing protein n=1 Tax=Klebsiella pneumoniae TaxID=573 RepID=UPI0025A025F9
LAAFEKTDALAPGTTQTLELAFDLKDMASYRESDGCFVLEAGAYILRLGNSSRNTVPVGVLTVEREIIVSRHEHICPLCEHF